MGAVQGVTEFLPISSSAHLVLLPWFFKWSDPGLTFDVALHFGTLLAVVVFFWREWMLLFGGLWRWLTGKISWSDNKEAKILIFLAGASVPGALAGYFLESQAESSFRHPLLIAATLFIFAWILWWVDKKGKNELHTREVSFKKSLFIGLSQALAIIPGVSRSGATISAGLLTGLRKESAAKFSFLLATPIILGASLVKLPEVVSVGVNWGLVCGVSSAAVSGFLAIWFLMRLVEKKNYTIFVWYRVLLALVIIIFWFIK